jgi:hypothetical protein
MFLTFPNPSSEILTIEKINLTNIDLNQFNEKAIYELYNNHLEIVIKGTVATLATIDVSSFKKGRYLLNIYGENKIETHHIIIK